MSADPIRIFCGADRSQQLPFLVLADSIRRHTTRVVEIRAIDNGDAPPVDDPRCAPYTEFSFARFAIPALCQYQGHAVYMDSDMLVFHDIVELWETPMGDGTAIAIECGSRSATGRIAHARNRHAAVMLMDNARLPWDVAEIVGRLGRDYDYNELMTLDPLLQAGALQERLPLGWNDLDCYDPARTRNLHYTEIRTQPWVDPGHPHGGLWVAALKRMIDEDALVAAVVHEEVEQGFARPSLLVELGLVPGADTADPEPAATRTTPAALAAYDEARGFVAHRKLLARFAQRKRAIARFERDRVPPHGLDGLWRRLRYRWRYGRD